MYDDTAGKMYVGILEDPTPSDVVAMSAITLCLGWVLIGESIRPTRSGPSVESWVACLAAGNYAVAVASFWAGAAYLSPHADEVANTGAEIGTAVSDMFAYLHARPLVGIAALVSCASILFAVGYAQYLGVDATEGMSEVDDAE